MGHYSRVIPAGYTDTLLFGDNRIVDERLAQYYDKLSLITRGDLWDSKRLSAIWNMTWGSYGDPKEYGDYADPRSDYGHPAPSHFRMDDLAPGDSVPPDVRVQGLFELRHGGIQFHIGRITHASSIEVTLVPIRQYDFMYSNKDQVLANRRIAPPKIPGAGSITEVIEVPPEAASRGYDAFTVYPMVNDGSQKIGHPRLIE